MEDEIAATHCSRKQTTIIHISPPSLRTSGIAQIVADCRIDAVLDDPRFEQPLLGVVVPVASMPWAPEIPGDGDMR
ncbi:hypothetical protein JCM9803A_41330 [Rhodococcus erythropolis]